MATDINIFLPIITLCIMLGVIGIWKKVPFLMLVGGVIIGMLAVLPLDLVNGVRVESIDTTDDINEVNWEDDPIQIDVYPKIFIGLLGGMFLLGGALIWKNED